jgi:hypothetical protein
MQLRCSPCHSAAVVGAIRRGTFSTRFRNVWRGRDALRTRSSGAGCLDESFAVSAMRARECRWYSTLSIIAPSVNLLPGRAGNHRRSEALHRRSLSDNLRRLARERIPTGAGEVTRSCHSYSVYQRFTSNRNKGLRVGSFLVRTFLGTEWSAKIHVDVNASLQSVKALEPEVLSAIERGA